MRYLYITIPVQLIYCRIANMLELKNIIYAINNGNDLTKIAAELDMSIDVFKSIISLAIETKYPDGVDVKQLTNDLEDEITWQKTKEEFRLETDEESGYDTDEEKPDPFDALIKRSPIPFSEEQLDFMRLAVKERKNISLLAPGGYGKSYALHMTVQLLKACIKQHTEQHFMMQYKYCKHEDAFEMATRPVVQLCASTGKAASLLQGARTLNSLLGIGLGRGTPDRWFKKVSTTKYISSTYNIIRSTHCIIIDEISMVGAELFDKISQYLRIVRQDDRAFGGIQIIVVGDFCQLSPVQQALAFRSIEYKQAKFVKVQFTKCFRQNDKDFTNALSELRFGELSDKSFKLLQAQTEIAKEYAGDLKPTLLCSTNSEVDIINIRELKKLCDTTNQTPKTYKVLPVPKYSPKKADVFRKADGIPEKVDLAIGAQVMVTFNLSHTIINGTQGIIIALKTESVDIKLIDGTKATVGYIGYKDPDCESEYDAPDIFQNLPLRLSHAITIHKAQGSTLQLLEVDCKKIFCHGMLYVAISRVTSLEGLILKNLTRKAIICNQNVKQFYAEV